MTDGALAEIFGSNAVPSVDSGARAGLKFTKVDELKSTLPIAVSADQFDTKLKTFFGEGLLHTSTENGAPYWAGIVGAGAMDMNPCLIEVTLAGSNATVVAHANEGLFKQKTCAKAIAKLEFALK